MSVEIINGDCLEELKNMPDESVDCCVTSPPYYALRDYGTGTWVGGDPNCPHKRLSKWSENTTTGHGQEELRGMVGDAVYKTICPLCGARREDKQIGLEETPEEFVSKLRDVFHEVKRVLKSDGTLWLNIGDSYWGPGSRGFDFTDSFTEKSELQKGSKGTIDLKELPKLTGNQGEYKNKDLIGIPWMVAFALRADGWYLRQDIIWRKPNPMPESVKDRCTKSHEYIFLFSKKPKYYFDYEAIQEESKWGGRQESRTRTDRVWQQTEKSGGGVTTQGINPSFVKITDKRNKRDVWSVATKAVKEAHFATFPEELIEPCIKAGCKVGGTVLDPFFGSGTTGRVAQTLNRDCIGIELNKDYIEISEKRNTNIQMTMEGAL